MPIAKAIKEEILLLARASSTNEEEGTGEFLFIKITRNGIENLRRLQTNVMEFFRQVSETHLISLNLPDGVEAFSVKAGDADIFEDLMTGKGREFRLATQSETQVETVCLRGRKLLKETENIVELEPVPNNLLELIKRDFESEIPASVGTIKFTGEISFFFALLYDYSAGYDFTETVELEKIEKLFN